MSSRAIPRLLAGAVLAALMLGASTDRRQRIEGTPPQRATTAGLWIDALELTQLPTSGAAWQQLNRYARLATDSPSIADQNDPTDTNVLAKGLVFARTGKKRYREEVIAACAAAIGTEKGARSLAVGRNLIGYVLAADLVELPEELDARFRPWLRAVVRERFDGRSVLSTHEDRPNNWGTHAGATRIAVAAYLGDAEDLARAATVFRGWLGDYDAYHGFKFRDLHWQGDPKRPLGINALGTERDGHSIDGVLADDQRRAGEFHWPPPHENYVYEALQGALAQAVLLERAGYSPWEWSDRALLRAFQWLYNVAAFPAEGDDRWQVHLINHQYGTEFPVAAQTTPGKNVGFLEWTHGSRKAATRPGNVPR